MFNVMIYAVRICGMSGWRPVGSILTIVTKEFELDMKVGQYRFRYDEVNNGAGNVTSDYCMCDVVAIYGPIVDNAREMLYSSSLGCQISDGLMKIVSSRQDIVL